MLAASGFRVFDLGVDVPIDAVVEKVREVGRRHRRRERAPHDDDDSASATSIEALRAAGLREQVKVMVGGAPVTPEWAAEIGADGFGEDAARAVSLARELVGA